MAKYQRLAKRTSSLYDKIYGSGVFESVTPSEPEEVKELEEARGGSKNLYQKIYGSKKTNEEVASDKKVCNECGETIIEGTYACSQENDEEYDDDFDESLHEEQELDEASSEWFTKMKNWLKETGAEEEEFFWSEYHDYVDDIYGRAIEKVTEDYEHMNVGFEFSTQAGRGMCEVWGSDDEGEGYYRWNFQDDREAVFEFVKESANIEELFNSLVGYLSGIVGCIEWEDNYNYDDKYDDKF